MTSPVLDRETVMRAVQAWPLEDQLALAQEILHRAEDPFIQEPVVAPDSQGLAGLIANGSPPPTDEEVAQWLDEHRMEKYGR